MHVKALPLVSSPFSMSLTMSTPKHVTGPGFGNHKSTFWKQAYEELNDEDKGRERLQKLDRLMTKSSKSRVSGCVRKRVINSYGE
jgi:hypothetical protein